MKIARSKWPQAFWPFTESWWDESFFFFSSKSYIPLSNLISRPLGFFCDRSWFQWASAYRFDYLCSHLCSYNACTTLAGHFSWIVIMSSLSAVDVAFIGAFLESIFYGNLIILIGLNFTQEYTVLYSLSYGIERTWRPRLFSLLSDLPLLGRNFFLVLDFTGMLVDCKVIYIRYPWRDHSCTEDQHKSWQTGTWRSPQALLYPLSTSFFSWSCGKFYLMLLGRTTDLTYVIQFGLAAAGICGIGHVSWSLALLG